MRLLYYVTTFVIKSQLTRRQQMNLGTGFLKFGGRGQQRGIHGNPVGRSHPFMQTPTDTVTLKGIKWEELHSLNIYHCPKARDGKVWEVETAKGGKIH